MPYSIAGKNLMLGALKGTNPGTPVTHAGLLVQESNKAVTGVASTGVVTATAHGYSNGDLVVLTALSGGSNVAVGIPFFVVNVATDTFKLAGLSGGSAWALGSDIISGTIARLTEVSGGSPAYARQAIAYGTPADAAMAFSGTITFEVPASTTVAWGALYSASTAGTLLAISNVTDEAFAGAGQYILSASTLDLLVNA